MCFCTLSSGICMQGVLIKLHAKTVWKSPLVNPQNVELCTTIITVATHKPLWKVFLLLHHLVQEKLFGEISGIKWEARSEEARVQNSFICARVFDQWLVPKSKVAHSVSGNATYGAVHRLSSGQLKIFNIKWCATQYFHGKAVIRLKSAKWLWRYVTQYFHWPLPRRETLCQPLIESITVSTFSSIHFLETLSLHTSPSPPSRRSSASAGWSSLAGDCQGRPGAAGSGYWPQPTIPLLSFHPYHHSTTTRGQLFLRKYDKFSGRKNRVDW